MVNILVAKPQRTPTMRMVTADGYQYAMGSTPSGFTYKDVPKFGTIDREGKKALTRKVAPGLRQLAFTHTVASPDYQESIQPVIMRFTNTASRGVRIRFTGGSGPFEQPCWWLIKDLAVTVTQRALNNEPSRASIAWTLEEWVDVTLPTLARRPTPKSPAAPNRPVKAPTRTHRIGSGDTLWGIAARYLHNGARWPEIFNMNRNVISNPNRISAGQVIRIPG
jgi:LysM repeat protein